MSAADVRTALPSIILPSPATSGLYHSQRPPLSVTAMLVQPASIEELSLEAKRFVQETVLHSDTVDLIAVHQGVGEPVEQVLDCQQRQSLVGRGVPPLPGLALFRWHDAPSFGYLKVGVVLYYDDPGLVPGL